MPDHHLSLAVTSVQFLILHFFLEDFAQVQLLIVNLQFKKEQNTILKLYSKIHTLPNPTVLIISNVQRCLENID